MTENKATQEKTKQNKVNQATQEKTKQNKVKQKKTVFRWFSIPQYKQEEEFLSKMHEQGWEFTKVNYFGFYHFIKCEPKKVVYRLDYNQDAEKNKEEYIQMFADCGWEYICDFVGYSYFRKGAAEDASDEIFCDEDSKYEMMKRVFRGRVIPLIIIFCTCILPQFFLHHSAYGTSDVIRKALVTFMMTCGFIYLILFGVFAAQFYQYEKMLYPDKNYGLKYAGIFAGLIACGGLMLGVFAYSFASSYHVTETANGFYIDSNRLNQSVSMEYELKPGDEIHVSHDAQNGELYISIGIEGEEPVFFGNTFSEFEDFSVEIQKEGLYVIKCSGKDTRGKVEFEIK